MAHGRGKKPPTRKEARRPNNKGAVRFGHHMPDKTVERFNPDSNNLPRERRKLSHGAALGTLGSMWDPINMPVGGIFTLSEAEEREYDLALSGVTEIARYCEAVMLTAGITYRVEAWSETVKVKQEIGVNQKGEILTKEVTIETTVTFFRPTNANWRLVPRDYTVKVDGEVTEYVRHADPNWRENVSKHYMLAA